MSETNRPSRTAIAKESRQPVRGIGSWALRLAERRGLVAALACSIVRVPRDGGLGANLATFRPCRRSNARRLLWHPEAQRSVQERVNVRAWRARPVEGLFEMSFYATFVKLRDKDNRPVPVSLPVQLSARSAGDAVSKLEQLREAGRWPAVANAVRLFKDGYELGLFRRSLTPA